MPLLGTGNAAVGAPFAETEFIDWVASITLANGASLLTGQTVIRDVTQISGAPGEVGTSAQASNSDIVVVPVAGTGANAPAFGVYQGPAITNNTGAAQTYTLLFRRQGYGVVLASAKLAGVAVKVGDSLITESGTDSLVISGAAVLNKTVGTAMATGAVTAYGASIIAVPGSGATTTLINADIWIR